jgi:hypothetical protein
MRLMFKVEDLRAAATAFQRLNQAVRNVDPEIVFDALSTEMGDPERVGHILAVLAQPNWTAKQVDPRRAAREQLLPPAQQPDPRWFEVLWPLTTEGTPETVRARAIEVVRYLLLTDGPARATLVDALGDALSESAQPGGYSRLYAELCRTRERRLVTVVEQALEDATPLTRARAASALLYEDAARERAPLVERLLAEVAETDDFRVFEAAISAIEAFATVDNASALKAAIVAWQARSAGLKKTRDEIPQPLLACQLLAGVAENLGIVVAKPTSSRKRRGLP